MSRFYFTALFSLLLVSLSFGYSAGLNGASYCGNPPLSRTCINCHSGNPLNSTLGTFTLNGLPTAGYTPGQTYTLTLSLNQATMTRWGFQLTSILQSNQSLRGGQIVNLNTNTSLTVGTGTNPDYLNMTTAGNYRGSTGPVTWQFSWRAPSSGSGMILFYSCGTPCNNNSSTTGDYVYTRVDSLREATTGNQPPNAFSLLSPPNGYCVLPPRVTLIWTNAIDPNAGDTVRYKVFWSVDSLFRTQDSASTGTVDSLVLTNLTLNTPYYWKVLAYDQTGLSRWSTEVFHFTMANGNPPTTPVPTSPPNGGSVVPDTVRFVWTGGVDPDSGDTVRFTICFLCAGDSVSYPIGAVNNNILIRIDTIRVWRSGYHVLWWVIANSNRPTVSVPSVRWAFMHARTSASEPVTLSPRFALAEAYPNPFNATTTIRYSLPASSYVDLRVFDISGREIATLIRDKQSAGYHSVSFDGSKLTSGVYLYRLQAGEYSEVRKMVFIK